MHRLGLNQVLLWTCVTRGKSPTSEPASLFIKRASFHISKLVVRRRVGAAFGGRCLSVAPSDEHEEGKCPGCPCLNPGSGFSRPIVLFTDKQSSIVTQKDGHKTHPRALGFVSNLSRPALEQPRQQLRNVATASETSGSPPPRGWLRPRKGSIEKRLGTAAFWSQYALS